MSETYKANRKKESTRQGPCPANATTNRELALLKTVFYRAVNDGILDRNPMQRVKLLSEKNARDRVLTPDEYEKLIHSAAQHIIPIIRIAHDLAMCENEILTLSWDRVDFENSVIILGEEHTKNRPREVPMNDGIETMLRELKNYVGPIYKRVKIGKSYKFIQHKGPRPVFTYNPRGTSSRCTVGSIKHAFDAACRRAGIEEFHFHDLRHTAITNMRKAGNPDRVIMRISGHKTLQMLDRYDKIDREDLREAVNKTATYTATKGVGKEPENPVSACFSKEAPVAQLDRAADF